MTHIGLQAFKLQLNTTVNHHEASEVWFNAKMSTRGVIRQRAPNLTIFNGKFCARALVRVASLRVKHSADCPGAEPALGCII